MFGLKCNFFTLPSKEHTLKFVANSLAFAVCIETTFEIALAASEAGLIPEIVVPYVPLLIGLMTGIQSDLLLEGNELKVNAKRLAKWFSREKEAPELLVNETANDHTNFNNEQLKLKERSCTKKFKKAFLGIAIPILWGSLLVVPVAKFFLSYYQTKQLLTDEELFQLKDSSNTVLAASIISGLIGGYYSIGTEGASAIEWLSENSSIKFNWVPQKIKKTSSLLISKIVKNDKIIMTPLALIGAINYSFLQSLSLYILLKLFKVQTLPSAIIAAILFFDMALQNFTFQGREFRKNAVKLYNYLLGVLPFNKNDYENIDKYELSKPQKILSLILKIIFIAIPTFAANFSLTKFTFTSGFEEYFNMSKVNKWQTIAATSGGIIAATGETLTETISAFDEIDEFIASKILKRN